MTRPTASAGAAQSPAQNEPVQVARFTLYPEGVYPRETSVGQGLVVIATESYRDGSAGVMVTREVGGGRSEEVARLLNRQEKPRRSRHAIRLAPGRYQLADLSRPQNTATLIVTREKIGGGQ